MIATVFLLAICFMSIYLLDQPKNLEGKKEKFFCPFSIFNFCKFLKVCVHFNSFSVFLNMIILNFSTPQYLCLSIVKYLVTIPRKYNKKHFRVTSYNFTQIPVYLLLYKATSKKLLFRKISTQFNSFRTVPKYALNAIKGTLKFCILWVLKACF